MVPVFLLDVGVVVLLVRAGAVEVDGAIPGGEVAPEVVIEELARRAFAPHRTVVRPATLDAGVGDGPGDFPLSDHRQAQRRRHG